MRYALTVPNLYEYADVGLLADMAGEAEAAGGTASSFGTMLYHATRSFPSSTRGSTGGGGDVCRGSCSARW
jgi:hypothetical protein